MDMTEEEFEPELKVWALEHFNQMALKAVWRPDGTGLRYRKKDELTLELEHRIDHPDALAHHDKITKLYASVNINMTDDNTMVTDAALSAEEAFRREVEERQAIAGSWTCECGVLLKNMHLETGVPTYIGDRDILFDDGDTRAIEDWGIKMVCHECDNDLMMNPDDFNLLGGDDLFMRYKTKDGSWVSALSRQQMYDLSEAGEVGILVGGTCPIDGSKVPPWMWGTYCSVTNDDESEEE